MYSSLLAMILSVLIALSGAGALPSTPETAMQTTIRDIAVTFNDNTYTIESEPVFTGAIGTDLAAGTFSVQLDGDTLMPIQASIDQNAIRLSMGDNGRSYTLSAETLSETTDCDMEDLQLIESAISYFAAVCNSTTPDAIEMNREIWRAVEQQLSPVESAGDADLGGNTVKLESCEGTLDLQSISALLDTLQGSDNSVLAQYMDLLLKFGNSQSDTDYATWSDMVATEFPDADAADLPRMTLHFDTAENGDDYIVRMTMIILENDTDADDDADIDANGSMIIECEQALENGNWRNNVELNFAEDRTWFTLIGTAEIADVLTESPAVQFSYTYDRSINSNYADEEDPDASFGYNYNASMLLTGDAHIADGLENFNLNLEMSHETESYSGADKEFNYSTDSSSSLNVSANDTVADNGGIDRAIDIALQNDDENRFGLSFVINRTETQFDAGALFDGCEEIPLTNAENDVGTARLAADILALANDYSTLLTKDSGFSDLNSAIIDLMCIDDYETYNHADVSVDDYDDYDVYDYDDYYQYLPVDQIMDQFTGTKLTIDVPEGYAVDESGTWISSDNNMAAITYRNDAEDTYIEINLRQDDSEADDYILLEGEDAGSLIESNIAQLFKYEDGYFGASLKMENVEVTLYFSEMPLQDVQALLETLRVAE